MMMQPEMYAVIEEDSIDPNILESQILEFKASKHNTNSKSQAIQSSAMKSQRGQSQKKISVERPHLFTTIEDPAKLQQTSGDNSFYDVMKQRLA